MGPVMGPFGGVSDGLPAVGEGPAEGAAAGVDQGPAAGASAGAFPVVPEGDRSGPAVPPVAAGPQGPGA